MTNFLAVIPWCLAFSAAAGNFLNISDIRLANGTGPYGGRVEIEINGIWGTVCDDSFDFDDATVMCRMMNLTASSYMAGAWYGQGVGPVFAREFECMGYESHLKDCRYVSNVECTHNRDIGIICSECPQIVISNGNAVDISAEGTVLSAICKNGFTSDTLTSDCSNGVWSPPSIICKYDIMDIRLVNGFGLYDGRVELLVNGTWGTICSTSFNYWEAVAICRIMFSTKYNSINWRAYSTKSIRYGPGEGPIYIDKLDCDTSVTSLNECSYSLDVSCTDHMRDVAIACHVVPLNIRGTRLVNGTGPYDGRIELNVDGHWGTICNRYIDMYDAQSICNTHNASLAMYFTETIYGEGTGPVHIDYITCNSNKDHINECSYNSVYKPCTHDYDLSIVCTSCGLPKIYNGEPFDFNNTELTVKCREGFFPDYIKMQCLDNGTWVENQRCTAYNAYPLNISDIRLRNKYGIPDEGRVELFVNGTWGTVCDTDFNSNGAAVICQMLGLVSKEFYTKASSFGRGNGAIFVDRLNCKGTETHINNCTYKISNYCTHYDDIGVSCTVSDCGDPTPENGTANTSATFYQTAVHVTCDRDYKLIGKENIICQADGTWSNQPICKLIDCGNATPEHSSSNTTITTIGTVVQISCIEGYFISGESIITCQANAKWTDYPSCEIKDCKSPNPRDADVTLFNDKTTVGETSVIAYPKEEVVGEASGDGSDKVIIILAVFVGLLVAATTTTTTTTTTNVY